MGFAAIQHLPGLFHTSPSFLHLEELLSNPSKRGEHRGAVGAGWDGEKNGKKKVKQETGTEKSRSSGNMAILGLPGRAEGSSTGSLPWNRGGDVRQEKVAKGPVASAAAFPLWLSPGCGVTLQQGH